MPPPGSVTSHGPRRRIDKVAVALGIAALLVLAGGLIGLAKLADRHARAEAMAEGFIETTGRVVQLWSRVVELGASGIEQALAADRATAGTMERRVARVEKTREAFYHAYANVEGLFSAIPIPAERRLLLDDLGELAAPVYELIGQIDGMMLIRSPAAADEDRVWLRGQLGAVGERYNQAQKAYQRLSDDSARVLRSMRSVQSEVAMTMLHLLYASTGTLLLLGLAAALHFRARARRERRLLAEQEKLLVQTRAAELRYRSIFNNAVEGIFQTTPDGRFITANRALARMYGYDSPEKLMERLSDISAQLYVEPSQRVALIEALQTSDVVTNYEFEVLRADGRTIWVRENVRAVRDGEGQLLSLEGTVEDVSDLWWGEQRRRLQYAITRVLGDAASVSEAEPGILRTICESLGWDFGLVWNVNETIPALHCVEVWHPPELSVGGFVDAARTATIRRGEGLTGEVWVSGEPRWIADLEEARGYASGPLA